MPLAPLDAVLDSALADTGRFGRFVGFDFVQAPGMLTDAGIDRKRSATPKPVSTLTLRALRPQQRRMRRGEHGPTGHG